MATKKPASLAPAEPVQPSKPAAPKRYPPDEYTGKEGTFIRDAETGLRRPATEAEIAAAAAPAEAPAADGA